MKILAVDSSAVTVSCAVADEEKTLACGLLNEGLTHSQTLMKLIDKTLRESELNVSDIECIAISAGPGSFTGVRIGIATVKGIAFADDIPCIGVSTLEAIAYGALELEGHIAAVMDARRDQVYTATFSVHNGRVERITEDRAISIAQLAEEIKQLPETVWLCGDGAAMCYNKLKDDIENLKLAPDDAVFQSGIGVARAAVAAGKDKIIKAENLVPAYLRLPQAERELNNKRLLNN